LCYPKNRVRVLRWDDSALKFELVDRRGMEKSLLVPTPFYLLVDRQLSAITRPAFDLILAEATRRDLVDETRRTFPWYSLALGDQRVHYVRAGRHG
jgi:hypothetical protein